MRLCAANARGTRYRWKQTQIAREDKNEDEERQKNGQDKTQDAYPKRSGEGGTRGNGRNEQAKTSTTRLRTVDARWTTRGSKKVQLIHAIYPSLSSAPPAKSPSPIIASSHPPWENSRGAMDRPLKPSQPATCSREENQVAARGNRRNSRPHSYWPSLSPLDKLE